MCPFCGSMQDDSQDGEQLCCTNCLMEYDALEAAEAAERWVQENKEPVPETAREEGSDQSRQLSSAG